MMESYEHTEKFRPSRMSLPDQIAENMIQQIEGGRWKVGEKIPSEPELMEMFGVSRNTIREATKSLVFTGILDSRPGIGTRVISASQLDATLNKCWSMAQIHDLHEVRVMLECQLAALVARNHTDEEMAELERLQRRRDEVLPQANLEEYLQCDADFHRYVAKMSHNKLMCDLYTSLLNTHIKQYIGLVYNLGYSIDAQEHTDLVEAIRFRDEQRTTQIVRSYLGRTGKTIFEGTANE